LKVLESKAERRLYRAQIQNCRWYTIVNLENQSETGSVIETLKPRQVPHDARIKAITDLRRRLLEPRIVYLQPCPVPQQHHQPTDKHNDG